LLDRAQPLLTVLSSAGNTVASVAAADLEVAMRTAIGPLARRLGWASSANPSRIVSDTEQPPWPVHEDSGIDLRAQTTLRPTALLQAVLLGDETIIAEALEQFRKSAGSYNSSTTLEAGDRAAFVASARYGTDADFTTLSEMWKMAPAGSVHRADLLFGLSVGAADGERCQIGLDAVQTLMAGLARVEALIDVLSHAPHCRDLAWRRFQEAARESWRMKGARATSVIVKGLATLSSTSELKSASALLAEQNKSVVSVDVAHVAITRVKINLDMVDFNSREASGTVVSVVV